MDDTKYAFRLEADEEGRVYAIRYRCCTVPRTVQLLGRNLADIMVRDGECHIESIGSCRCLRTRESGSDHLHVFTEHIDESSPLKQGSVVAADRLDRFNFTTGASSVTYLSAHATSLADKATLDGKAYELWETLLEVAAEVFSSPESVLVPLDLSMVAILPDWSKRDVAAVIDIFETRMRLLTSCDLGFSFGILAAASDLSIATGIELAKQQLNMAVESGARILNSTAA